MNRRTFLSCIVGFLSGLSVYKYVPFLSKQSYNTCYTTTTITLPACPNAGDVLIVTGNGDPFLCNRNNTVNCEVENLSPYLSSEINIQKSEELVLIFVDGNWYKI